MLVNIYEANENLKPFVNDYYYINCNNFSHENVPPLGFPVIQFHLISDVDHYFSEYKINLSRVMMIGQLSKYAHLSPVDCMKMIGVNLFPTSLYKLFKLRMNEISDTGVPAESFFGKGILEVLLEVSKIDEASAQIAKLDAFFMDCFKDKNIQFDKFDELVATVQRRNGIISGKEMMDLYPTSERNLQRIFLKRVGLSPKTYCRVLRHLNIFKIIANNPQIKYSQLIYECGYNDSAHFSRDFKLVSGVSPKEYFSKNEEMAFLLTKD